MKVCHCFRDDALGSLDAVALAASIRAGERGREEVLEDAIARVEAVQPQLAAVAAETFDLARAEAPVEGPLAGVPGFVKDNVELTGLPTGHGSAALRPKPARSDGPPVQQFRGQGLVVLGKSTLPEFSLSATTEYVGRAPTRNPWDTGRSVGGSSGGAAALVASGAIPIAHGNDGGGSIRIPAAAAGLVGLKATRARFLDSPGTRQLPVNHVTEGVLTRSVRDTARYLAGAEAFRANPSLERVGMVEGPADRRLRIGLVERDLRGREFDPEMRAALASAAAALAGSGHELVEMRFDVDPGFLDDFTRYWALLAALSCVALIPSPSYRLRPSRLDPFTRGLVRHARANSMRMVGTIRRLRRVADVYESHFDSVDAILSPVVAHPAPALGELAPDQPFEELWAKLMDYVPVTPFHNVGGGPGIAVPHGMLDCGLPGSVQISGPAGAERTLLELAYELEDLSPFPRIEAATDTPTGAPAPRHQE